MIPGPALEAPLPTVDLATLTAQLRDLGDEALPRIAAAPDLAALDELDLHYLGRKGGALSVLMRGIGGLPVEDRPRVGVVVNEVRAAVETALADARARAGNAALAARLAAETVDVTAPARIIPRGALAPDRGDDRADHRDLRPVRVRHVRGPGGRDGRHQLPDAQHPARPSGARPVGHPLRRPGRRPAADPHLARPDPGHARRATADPGPAAGQVLPLRGDRCLARVGVLPGRGPHGGRGHEPRRT